MHNERLNSCLLTSQVDTHSVSVFQLDVNLQVILRDNITDSKDLPINMASYVKVKPSYALL